MGGCGRNGRGLKEEVEVEREEIRVMDGRMGREVIGEEGRESLLPSVFTGSELLYWELKLEWVPKTLKIQFHLESMDKQIEKQGGRENRTT